jgi:excisionase family DNA binding protein
MKAEGLRSHADDRASLWSSACSARRASGQWERGGGVTAVHIAKRELRPFFTPKALADYLSISERTVREMLSKQRIPSYKVEGQRRINPLDVEEYLARNRNGAT